MTFDFLAESLSLCAGAPIVAAAINIVTAQARIMKCPQFLASHSKSKAAAWQVSPSMR
jgi:hypothetical protein